MRTKSRRLNRHQTAARVVAESLESRTLLSAGDLDPTFGSGGKILLPDHNGSVNYSVNTTAVQSDGKILIAGGGFLERINTDGSVDTTFGSNGVVTTSFPGTGAINSLVIQSDGKIVFGGTDEPDGTAATDQFAVARYNTNGTLDTTFGTGGQVLTPVPGVTQNSASLALDPATGQIVAGGMGTYQDPAHPSDSSYSAPVFDFVRYNLNGTLDTTLNGTGYVYRELRGAETDINYFDTDAVAVQGDGKVLIGAHFQGDMAVWRFNVNGTQDSSFGLRGMATVPFQFSDVNDDYDDASVSQILVQPNGQIVLAGPRDHGDETRGWVLSRLNSDGSVDALFGNEGIVIPNLQLPGPSGGISIGGLALQSDGKIVVGGVDPSSSYPEGYGSFIVLRLFADGSTDSTFHSSDLNYFTSSSEVNLGLVGATAMSPDGSIIVAGNVSNNFSSFQSGYQSGISVFRLQGDSSAAATSSATPANPSGDVPGDPDPTFAFQGRTLLNDPSPVAIPSALTTRVKATTVLPNGQILLAGSIGTVGNNGEGQFYLERLNSDGTIDTSFGSGGIVTTSIGPNAFATSMLVLSNGQIILGGATDDSATAPTNANFAMVRYNANGSVDTTFGSNGIVITDFPGNEEIDSMALSLSGQVIAAGAYFLYPNVGFDVARYNTNGSLDTTFNGNGMLSYNLGETGSNSFPPAIGVQSDSKIVIGSHTNSEFAVYRFNVNGSIDTSFGNAGIATTSGTLSPNVAATSTGAIQGSVTKLVIQGDGKIVAAGQTNQITPPYALVRFNSNGSVDRGFASNGGTVISDPNAFVAYQDASFSLASLLLQANGEIILVGNEQSPFGRYMSFPGPALLMEKFLPDGTVDPYFQASQDPAFIPPPPYRGAFAEAAALAPSGNVVLADDVWADGSANSPHWLGVARFLNNTDYYNVTKLTDDGSVGTFRWAMDGAAATYPGATVGFQPGLNGTITLSQSISEGGNPSGTVWIKGPGAPVISINGSINTSGSISVSGVTLLSGGVFANGSSSYTDSTIHGGVSENQNNLSILRCTFNGDNASSYGISEFNNGESTVGPTTVYDSTFTGYTSAAIAGGPGMTIINCTIDGNSGLGISSSSLSIGNTIVAGNGSSLGPDVSGPVVSLGHNLIGNASNSSGWVSSDLLGTSASPINPQLLPLGYYGGPTQTMPPKVGSPAIDAGDNSLVQKAALLTDQRGFDRVSDGTVDIGAVETSYITINGTSGSDTINLSGSTYPTADVIVNIGTSFVRMSATDPLGSLTINGNGGSDVTNLDGKSLPANVHLNGTFTINGMSGGPGAPGLAGTNLELGRSTVYISYAGAASDPIAAIRRYLQTGYNNGAWNGVATPTTGVITSIPAAQNAARTTAIGYADSADGLIAGQPANTIELKYTLYGDTTLSGSVGFNDFTRMTQHYNQTSGGTWDTGDFNYDGSVNSADFTLLSRTYNTSLGSQATPATAAASAGAPARPTTTRRPRKHRTQ